MQEIINEKVSVITLYSKEKGISMPVKINWQGKVYSVLKLGYHHKYKQGRTLIHVFSVSSETMFFKLEFNSDTLSWTLAEISDGTCD